MIIFVQYLQGCSRKDRPKWLVEAEQFVTGGSCMQDTADANAHQKKPLNQFRPL
jgi:hypothetical protein